MNNEQNIIQGVLNEKLNKLLGTSGVDYFAPSNFVKLLKINLFSTQVSTVGSYYSNLFNSCDTEKLIIEQLADALENWMNAKNIELVKQQAQQTNFDY